MARLFDNASSQYLENTASAPVTAEPMTFSAWIYPDETDAFQSVVQIQDKDASRRHTMFAFNATAYAFSNGTGGTAQSTVDALTLNAWNHIGAVFTASNSRTAWANGSSGTTNTTSITVANLDSISVGRAGHSSPSDYMSGRIAEVAIWNAALNSNEMIALSRGVSPLYIRRANLVEYWPLWGLDSPELSAIGSSRSLTLGGSPTRANHAPVALFSRRRHSMIDVAEAPTGPPVGTLALLGAGV